MLFSIINRESPDGYPCYIRDIPMFSINYSLLFGGQNINYFKVDASQSFCNHGSIETQNFQCTPHVIYFLLFYPFTCVSYFSSTPITYRCSRRLLHLQSELITELTIVSFLPNRIQCLPYFSCSIKTGIASCNAEITCYCPYYD